MYTHKENGINVHDYGAHIFHTDNKEVWSYVNQLTEFNGYINQVVANYKGELYNLPFNMNTFYQMWGVKTPAEAQAKISEQREAAGIKGAPKNLEEQAIRLIGTDIYEKLIKGYTEKQWDVRLRNYQVLLFAVCQLVLLLIIITLTIAIKAYLSTVIQLCLINC